MAKTSLLMESTNKPRPSVPSGPAIPDSGGGHGSGGAEGARNLWKLPSRHNPTTLTLACYNARTLRTDERLLELQVELEQIKWDVIGLSEVRRKGEDLMKLNSGELFFYRGHEDSSYGGVGFLIAKSMVSLVTNIKSVSTRVCFVVLQLNKRYSLKVVQVYAPTSDHSDEEVEEFYEDVAKALDDTPCHFNTIIGDFNAKIGQPLLSENSVGKFGHGIRNKRGQALVNFLEHKKLYAMNTFFQKRSSRKWTWVGPGGQTKNEIDYVISSHKYVVSDVSVVSRLKTGSDHRMVRATLNFDLKNERTKMVTSQRRYEKQEITSLPKSFQIDLNNQFKGLEESNLDVEDTQDLLCRVLTETVKKHLGRARKKDKKLSLETLEFIKKRREMRCQTISDKMELDKISKLISKSIKRDLRRYNADIIINTIKTNRGPKVFRRKTCTGSKQILKLKNHEGNTVTDRLQIVSIVEKFYENLYKTNVKETNSPDEHDARAPPVEHLIPDTLPPILPCEIKKALYAMKVDKSPGEDGVTVEMLRAGGDSVLGILLNLFNRVMYDARTPQQWKNAIVTIMHKKGDIANLANYRPISLLSHIYKLFAKILTNRLTRVLDEAQPIEQAGFRSGFSTTDHIHTVKQLMEKCHEYNRPLVMAFVDYEKAFDSVEHWAVFHALHRCCIDSRYVNLLRELYTSATLQVRVHNLTNPVPIRRGVRQGDTISPKLFTAVLEDAMKMLEWENLGININGVNLSHLRFADDLVLFAESFEDLQRMLNQLYDVSLSIGLKMNMSKTKVMGNLSRSTMSGLTVGNKNLELVNQYVYLGHILSFGKEHQKKEIERRIQLGWAAFGKFNDIFKSVSVPQCLKTRLYNQCVLPTMTYGAETWTLTKEAVYRIRVTQRAMERAMLGINLLDRVPNIEIRRRTKVQDVGMRVMELKWSWAGHLARRGDDRWSKSLTEWWPRTGKRSVGRPAARWADDIVNAVGRRWMRAAQNRADWKEQREAYTQQWVKSGCG